MAVVSVKERFEDRESSSEGSVVTIRRSFVVICDAITDGPDAARTAASIPDPGDAHPTNTSATVRRVRAVPIDNSPLAFRVSVEYSNAAESGAEGSGTEDPNPLLRPPDVRFGFQRVTKATSTDVNGNAMVASNGKPFSAMQVEVPRAVKTVTVNVADFSESSATGIINTISSSNSSALMYGIEAQQLVENGFTYWRVTYEVHYDVEKDLSDGQTRQPWQIDRLNEDVDELKNGVLTEITVEDSNGDDVPVRTPVLLDANGAAAPSGPATYQIYTMHNTASWNL